MTPDEAQAARMLFLLQGDQEHSIAFLNLVEDWVPQSLPFLRLGTESAPLEFVSDVAYRDFMRDLGDMRTRYPRGVKWTQWFQRRRWEIDSRWEGGE